jgi:tetratricopeptide (TPR) repeat protein
MPLLSFLSPGQASDLSPQERARRLNAGIRNLTLIALLVITLAVLLFEIVELRQGPWASAAAFSLAAYTAGLLLGFLFSIPKAAEDPTPDHVSKGSGDVSPSTANATPEAEQTAVPRKLLSVNTNFEQISDWLTKIIVGVGLVESKQIIVTTGQLTGFLAAGFASASRKPVDPSLDVLALAIIIGFPSLGTLTGYLYTRLYVARALGEADAASTRPEGQISANDKATLEQTVESKGSDLKRSSTTRSIDTAALNDNTRRIALEIASKDPRSLASADDLYAWCNSQLALGNFAAAFYGYSILFERDPDNPRTRFEYARALEFAGRLNEAIEQLQLAYSNRTLISSDLRSMISEELVNAQLMTPPPAGFTEALAILDSYVKVSGASSMWAWILMALALGQRYNYRLAQSDPNAPEELPGIVESARRALALDQNDPNRQAQYELVSMIVTGGREDLRAAAAASPELRRELGLPA